MAIVNVNSISGINSITAQSGSLNFYDSAGGTLSIGASVSGNITGNVTGNLTGNVTGNATGLSGNPNITVSTIGVNGASPQSPIDAISNSSGNGITVRGRSADGLGNIRFTSNDYATLYGGLTHNATNLNLFNERSGSLILGSNGIDRVTIDSSGRVTTPYQPMMATYQCTSGSLSVSGGATVTLIPAAGASYDPNNNFDESTGIYTIPVSGRYYTYYGTQGKTAANTNAGSIYYNVNNSGIAGQVLYYGEAYSGSMGAAILNLSANDTIRWQIFGNNNQSYTLNGAHYGIKLIG